MSLVVLPVLRYIAFSLNVSRNTLKESSSSCMNLPGYRLHSIKGDKHDMWSVTVNGNWRMTFYFEGKDAYLVDYMDYH